MKKVGLLLLSALLLATSQLAPAGAAPGKPTGVSVSSKSPAGTLLAEAVAEVAWAPVTGAVAYSISATADGKPTQIGGSPICDATACKSTVSPLTGGINYSFLVTAVDRFGATTAADPVGFTAKSVPDAPVVVSAVSSANQVTLTWTAPSNTGGFPITGYSITDGAAITKTAAASATSLVITNISASTPYAFKIKATNSLGSSAEALFPSLVSLGKPGAPNTPTAIFADGLILVSWAVPEDGGSPITGYKVFVINSDGTDLGDAYSVTGANSTSKTISGIADGTYTVKVLATNAVGDGPRSSASAAVTVVAALQTQSITFSGISAKTYPGTFVLSASATSNLTVTFTASGSCSISGTTVTLLGVGTCAITARQTGNQTYAAAQSVTQSFSVTAAVAAVGGGGGGGFIFMPTPTITPTPILTPKPTPSPTQSPSVKPSPIASPPAKVLNAPMSVTAKDVASLSTGQVAAIPASTLAKLPVAAIGAITAAQAKVLTSAQVSALPLKSLVKLQAKAVAALTPRVIAKLSNSQLIALTNAQVKSMTSAQIAVLTKSQRKALGR